MPHESAAFLLCIFFVYTFCLVLIKKMHELRSSQVTPVEFESCHLHILDEGRRIEQFS